MSQWTILVFLNRADLCIDAAKDALAQDTPDPRVLIVNNGGSSEDRLLVERFCLDNPKALAWHHDPPLPSLSATWNRALRFVWEQGCTEALVGNHDIRMTRDTWRWLQKILVDERALLVTATGVEEEETLFAEALERGQEPLIYDEPLVTENNEPYGKVKKGGPGFSLFMISREGHLKYPFDEMLIPAFCEDLDLHRRFILGGDGDRIFGTNVRYLHLGGQTLKNMSPEQREATEKAITNGARAHYARKWGGGANEEKFIVPFQDAPDADQVELAEIMHCRPAWITERAFKGEAVKNPDLFDYVRSKW